MRGQIAPNLFAWEGDPTDAPVGAFDPPKGAIIFDLTTPAVYEKTSAAGDNSGYRVVATEFKYTLIVNNETGDTLTLNDVEMGNGVGTFGLVNIGEVLTVELEGGTLNAITVTAINGVATNTANSIMGNYSGDSSTGGTLMMPLGPRGGSLTIHLAS